MPRSHSLYLEVVSAHLDEQFGTRVGHAEASVNQRSTSLGFWVRMGDFPLGGASLSTGEKLKNLRGSIGLRPKNGSADASHIGTLNYLKSVPPSDFHQGFPASYDLQVLLPNDLFVDLLTNIRSGKMPTQIKVEVTGFDLKTEFEILWDTKTSPQLSITEIQFSVPLVINPEENRGKPSAFERPEIPSFHPVNRDDFSRLENLFKSYAETVSSYFESIKSSVVTLFWVAVVVYVVGKLWTFFSAHGS